MRAFTLQVVSCCLFLAIIPLLSAEGRNSISFGIRSTVAKRNDMIWPKYMRLKKNRLPCQQLSSWCSLRGGHGDQVLKQITDLEEVEALVQHENHKEGSLILLEFLAEDCDECRRMEPILTEWVRSQPSEARASRVIPVRIILNDVYDAIAENYQVTKWPAYLFIKQGVVQLELVGANVAEATLVDWIQLLTPKSPSTNDHGITHEDENKSNE